MRLGFPILVHVLLKRAQDWALRYYRHLYSIQGCIHKRKYFHQGKGVSHGNKPNDSKCHNHELKVMYWMVTFL